MTDVVLRIQTALGGAVAEVAKFRQSIADTSIATADLRSEWKATTAEIVAQTQKQIASEKEKIDAYRGEIKAINELTATYAKGSDERRIATQMEIDLQRKLQASLGETAAVAKRTATESGVARDASGFSRGAASRSGVIGAGMSALAGPGFLAGAVIGGALDAGVKAARAEQVAQMNLGNALKDVGQARKISQKALNDYVVEEEHATGFQRDEVMQTLSQLIRSTGSLAKARQEEAVMANVARARNTDLSGAMMLVMRAAEGNVGSLKRLGIEIPKVTTYEDQLKAAHLTGNLALEKRAKALDLAATKSEVMRAVTQKFAGASAGYMKTFGGETASLSNRWRDLEIEIGQKAIPTLTSVIGWLNKEIAVLEHSKSVHRDLHDAAVAVYDTFKAGERVIEEVDKVTGGFGNTLKLILTYLAVGKILDYAGAIQTKLVGAFGAAETAAKRMVVSVTTSEGTMVATSEEAGVAVDAAFPWAAVAQAAAVVAVLIIEHWKTVKRWFGEFWDYTKATAAAAWDVIKGLAYQAVYVILQYATAAIRGILEVASHLPFVGDKARAALDAINGYIDKWHKQGNAEFQRIGTDWGNALGQNLQQSIQQHLQQAARQVSKSGGYLEKRGGYAVQGPLTGAGGTAPGGGKSGAPSGIIGTAKTQLGVAYQFGGPAKLGVPTDCSGFVSAVLDANGIHVGRLNAAELYSQAPVKDPHPLLPGDLVFYDRPHIGHVAIYLGNGRIIQDPHTGASVSYGDVGEMGGPVAAARWWKGTPVRGKSGGGGGSSAAGSKSWGTAVQQAQQAATSSKQAKSGVKAPTLIGLKGMIDAELKDLPGDLDPVEKAAIDHIKKIRASLHPGMSQTELAKDRVALAKWGKQLKDEIKKNADSAKKAAVEHAKEVKAAARATAKAWADGWQADVTIINRSISEQWANVQKQFDRETQKNLTAMQRAFQTNMNTFDAETQKGLQSFVVAQTPEEKALSDFQAQRAAQQSATQHAQLQSDLAAAIASGDPQQIQQAQQAINDQLQQDQEDAMQKAADASRAAQDAKTQQQQDAYQADRDAQKQALQDQEAQAEQAYQDARDAQWQHLNDMHDDQVAMFDADLKLWQTALQNKTKTWAEFLKWMKANPISDAVDGGTISDPLNYTEPTLPTSPGGGGGKSAPPGSGGTVVPRGPHGFFAGAIHMRPTVGMVGEQGPEASFPLTGQVGQAAILQLARAIAAAGGGHGPGTVVYGTFLGATEKQVGRALEGLVTPAARRVVRYKAPL